MKNYQQEFLKLAINEEALLYSGALLFGEFTLKSKRKSPYFFQAGVFNNGASLQKIGTFLTHTIMQKKISFDGLFGPAYKGIPLVSATAVALAEHYDLNKPWSFNRKVVKDYGEGGVIVGAPLTGKILIVDDVLTAGTAINESIELIHSFGTQAEVCGVITLLDRCEVVNDGKSAKTLIKEKYDIPVFSIISIYDVIEFLHQHNRMQDIQAIEKHLQQYGEK